MGKVAPGAPTMSSNTPKTRLIARHMGRFAPILRAQAIAVFLARCAIVFQIEENQINAHRWQAVAEFCGQFPAARPRHLRHRLPRLWGLWGERYLGSAMGRVSQWAKRAMRSLAAGLYAAIILVHFSFLPSQPVSTGVWVYTLAL